MHLGGVPDAPVYKTIEEATAAAETYLREHLAKIAAKAGCHAPAITITDIDATAPSTDGTTIFICRTIEGCASGAPDCCVRACLFEHQIV